MPSTEFCGESYLEFRDSNATGPLLEKGRYCGQVKQIEDFIFADGALWIKLRYTPSQSTITSEEQSELAPLEEREEGLDGSESKNVPFLSLQFYKG